MATDKREAHLKHTIWKLAHAKRSVVHVRSACDGYEKLVDAHDHPMHVPLMCAISVMYSRPFTNNNGVGMISAKLARYADPALQKTHDLLWDTRNFLSAHTDASILIKSAAAAVAKPQDIQIVVTRERTASGDVLSFHHAFHEMKLIGATITDIRQLCDEFDRRLDDEIRISMFHLYGPSGAEFLRALDERRSDCLHFPLGFVPLPLNSSKR